MKWKHFVEMVFRVSATVVVGALWGKTIKIIYDLWTAGGFHCT